MNDPNSPRAADTPPPACSAPDETPRWLISVAALLLMAFCAAVITIGFAYGTVAGCAVVAILAFWLLRSIASVMTDHQEKPNAAGQGRREATYPEPACSQGGCQ